MTPSRNQYPTEGPPLGIKIVATLVLMEAAMLVVVGIWYVTEMLQAESYRLGVALFTLALLVLAIGWLVTIAVCAYRAYRWTRSAALVWQLFLVILAFPLFNGGNWVPALVMLLPAATVLILLFTQPVVSFMGRRSESSRAF